MISSVSTSVQDCASRVADTIGEEKANCQAPCDGRTNSRCEALADSHFPISTSRTLQYSRAHLISATRYGASCGIGILPVFLFPATTHSPSLNPPSPTALYSARCSAFTRNTP